MAKISFGTVEELFSELKEKNQTEARIEPACDALHDAFHKYNAK